MKKLIILFFITLSFFIHSNSILADELYQINLIVFKHVTYQGVHSENWPTGFKQPDLKNIFELEESNKLQPEYVTLPRREWGLQREATILKRKGYQILTQMSWIQPVGNLSTSRWIHVIGGELYGQSEDEFFRELNGKIRISKAKFFDINTKLYFSLPSSVMERSDSLLQTFTLFENRRTRINKINYLDHPLFGMLIQITSYHV